MRKQGEFEVAGDAQKSYRCGVHFYPAEDGVCVFAADLSGVVNEGETGESAIGNIIEAYQAVIESYRAHHQKIPRKIPGEPAENERACWIEVHA
jgi:predicted RNase H-like HicB family nuclease